MLFCLTLASAAFAQKAVSPENQHERVWLVLPIIGAGVPSDPKRPQLPTIKTGNGPEDILSWSRVPSDDGKSAIVEVVSRSRATIAQLTADPKAAAKIDKGKTKPEDIEKELQKYSKSFSLKPPKDGGKK